MFIGILVVDVFPIMLISIFLYAAFVGISRTKNLRFSQHFFRYAFLAYILTLVGLTIFWGGISIETDYHLLNLRPFVWVKETYSMGFVKMIKQIVGNVFMFVPYGFLLPVVFKKMQSFGKTFLIVFLSSFLIEFVQYFIGRSCDVDDLIMNTIGGCIGYGVFFFCNSLKRDKIK